MEQETLHRKKLTPFARPILNSTNSDNMLLMTLNHSHPIGTIIDEAVYAITLIHGSFLKLARKVIYYSMTEANLIFRFISARSTTLDLIH